MSNYLGYSVAELEQFKGFWTAKEIEQQPECWRETIAILDQHRALINDFMTPILAHSDLRIVLTGAGTSAFVGRSLSPILTQQTQRRVEAISTTDIVSNSYQYFAEDIPTLLVSFARSGNSPESVEAVKLANQFLSNCYHLVLTCNDEGQLYVASKTNDKSLAILMPEKTNDKSFAMTSSFSSMMLSAFSILGSGESKSKDIESICNVSAGQVKEINKFIGTIDNTEVNKVIYLGSGGFKGIAEESALKLLELTAGKVVISFDSPLGFRHGPKSIVDDKTLIFVYISNDQQTRKYDLDLLAELRRDGIANKVIAITAQLDDQVSNGDYWLADDMQDATDAGLLFSYILVAQIYAFQLSVELGNTPDNPCPTGEVNRVVQGVTIHKFNN
ncbi:MAG: SIS domain-containing protein [Moritella sp.]|uniref:SIS domain-containing protein n=1 Tax=Moritella sp. TaxID=78556 RepID=UPI0025F531FF|nr:SIS domain-containing protein [Moritella sp.]NQZ94285.1 SIS domain-containing protein [Moritella sp.]